MSAFTTEQTETQNTTPGENLTDFVTVLESSNDYTLDDDY